MEKIKDILWDEWVQRPTGHKDATEEIAGIISGMKSRENGQHVICQSGRLWVFRRLRKIWNLSCWTDIVDLSSILIIPKGFKGKVLLQFPSVLYKKILGLKSSKKANISWTWLGGFLGACASFYLPKTGYYLTFRGHHGQLGDHIDLVYRFLLNNGFPAKIRHKTDVSEVIIRDQQSIVALLVKVNLHRTSLELEQKALLRALRDTANKIVNCDAANIKKTLEAARKQIEIANDILAIKKIVNLPDSYVDLAEKRIAYPTATLKELGALLERPVSKSTIEYRWKKMEKILMAGPKKIAKGDGQNVLR